MTAPVKVTEAPDGSFNPTELARSIVSKLGNDQAAISEGIVPVGSETVKVEAQVETKVEAVPEGTEVTEVKPEVEEVEQAATPEEIAQVEQLLGEAGFDFGISYAELPEEFRPLYARVLQSAADIAQNTIAQKLEADDLVEQVKEFAERLKSEPDKVLISLALSNPDAFAKAVSTFTEMQQDERIKSLVVRELQSEARIREADRRDRVTAQSTRQAKVQRVVSAARRAAQVHGIPWNLAEAKIADTIAANNNDIEPSAVDGVLKAYATELSKAGRKPVPRVATKEKVDATKTVPNQPTGDATAPVTPDKQPSKGLTVTSPHDRLKGIIRGALAGFRAGAQ